MLHADSARTDLRETALRIKKYYKVKLTNSNRTMGRRMLLLLSLLWLWLLHCSCCWYGSQDYTDCNQAKAVKGQAQVEMTGVGGMVRKRLKAEQRRVVLINVSLRSFS